MRFLIALVFIFFVAAAAATGGTNQHQNSVHSAKIAKLDTPQLQKILR
jgi:hypothetical protein